MDMDAMKAEARRVVRSWRRGGQHQAAVRSGFFTAQDREDQVLSHMWEIMHNDPEVTAFEAARLALRALEGEIWSYHHNRWTDNQVGTLDEGEAVASGFARTGHMPNSVFERLNTAVWIDVDFDEVTHDEAPPASSLMSLLTDKQRDVFDAMERMTPTEMLEAGITTYLTEPYAVIRSAQRKAAKAGITP